MDIDAYRDLRLLTEISSEEVVTQRSLARTHGLALGLTNLLVRRLIRKGYIKVINMQRNRIRYLVTPQGLAEKARLTYAYLEYSLFFYRQIRTFLRHALASIRPADGTKILLCGAGEVAEIAYVVLQQYGVKIVGVIDEQAGVGPRFLGHSIKSLTKLSQLSFDRVVVASLAGRQEMVQQLLQRGVAAEKIIVIPDEQSAEFRHIQADMAAPLQQGALPGGVPV